MAESIGSCGCASIPTNSTGIITRFQEVVKTVGPGLACYCCCSDEVYVMSNKIRQLENKTTTIDKDQVAVTIVTEVQYQVTSDHTQLAFTQLRNPGAQMKSWIDNCLRSYATGHSIQQLFQSTNEAGDHIQDALQKTMSGYGYTIIKVLVTSILVPEAIRAAMNSRTEQSLLRVAQEQTSERNKIATTVQAEADATQMIRLAEAESRKKMILAQADAEVSTSPWSWYRPGTRRDCQGATGGLRWSRCQDGC